MKAAQVGECGFYRSLINCEIKTVQIKKRFINALIELTAKMRDDLSSDLFD